MYLGWLCGAQEDEAALRASASLELLHAFALMQDDVMDESALRRGRPSAHVSFSPWHRERRLTGSSDRFGESAAILLGDLCLVWAEKMLRESGVDAEALGRVWPRYDDMRMELAIGQFADLVNDSHAFPTFTRCLTWPGGSRATTRCGGRWRSEGRWPGVDGGHRRDRRVRRRDR